MDKLSWRLNSGRGVNRADFNKHTSLLNMYTINGFSCNLLLVKVMLYLLLCCVVVLSA